MFGLLTYIRIAGVLGVLAVVGYVEVKTYNAGYNSAKTYYERVLTAIREAAATEVAKEKEANAEAVKTAQEAIAKLQTDNDTLTKALKDADVAAAKDANAKRIAIGSASVQRLNYSRGRRPHTGAGS